MKVTDIRATPVSCSFERTLLGSSYGKGSRATVVVTVETDAETTGRTYSGDFGDVGRDRQAKVVEFIREKLRPLVVGRDLFSLEAIWEDMFSRSKEYLSFMAGERFLYVHAIGAVDTALWDTVGKTLDVPLYQLWGGYRNSLPIIGFGYYESGKDVDDLMAEMQELRSAGFGGVKLKVGKESTAADLERVAAVRNEMGDEFIIGCDANQGWTVDEAVAFATQVEEYDLRWLEEPVAWSDQYHGMREVRRRTNIPVTAGQSEISMSGCRHLVENNVVDILNFDASWGGGPTVWQKIAAIAESHGVSLMHHEEPHLAMHLLASAPNSLYVEGFPPELDPVFYEMVENPPSIENGRLHLPDRPGFGLELNDDFIREHCVELST